LEPDPYSYLTFLIIKNFQEFLAESWAAILALLVLSFLSAIFSAYETSFFSLQREEIEEMKENLTLNHKIILKHLNQSHFFLATILIGINFVNIGIVLFSHELLANLGEWFHLSSLVLSILDIVLITSFLLIFAEITPKVFASANKKIFLKNFTLFMEVFYYLFYPFSYALSSISFLFKGQKTVQQNIEVSMEELKHAIDLTSDQFAPKEEKEILKGLVNFRNILVKAVMTARVDMKCVSKNDTPEIVIQKINEYGYSRLPVYEVDSDHIVGILYVKDILPLIKTNQLNSWQTKIRPPFFVPENMKINKLLTEFQKRRLHIAIVVDEFGGTSGLVSLEDILEEIFGEISDEYDEEEILFKIVNPENQTFWLDGKLPIINLCKNLELEENPFEEVQGDSETVGGLISEVLGRFPQKNDKVEYKNFEFIVENASEFVVESVILRIKDHHEANSSNST
jgi:gliding motility-associated protein GldE